MVKNIETIHGDTFLLRPLEGADIQLARCWRNKDYIRNSFVDSQIILPDQQVEWFKRYIMDDRDLMYIIEDTDRLRMPVGTASLYNLDLIEKTAEFGRLMIGEPLATGKGLGMKASSILCQYGFAKLGLKLIYLIVFKDNYRAIRIYEQIGFKTTITYLPQNKDLIRMELLPSAYAPGLPCGKEAEI